MSTTEEKQNGFNSVPIKELKGKKFIIESYQRGYKWGKKEILELLNDINEYDKTKGIYCVQPLIVKSNNDNSYEIIDGQQRTTSIFLILEYLRYNRLLQEEVSYEIEYKVRDKSGCFLKNIKDYFEKFPKYEDANFDDYTYLNDFHDFWGGFIENKKEFDNVDVYHFCQVLYYLSNWIDELGEEKKKEFIDKLLSKVNFIWYQLDDNEEESQNVIDVFINNNKGKIPLTESELIKALFILNITKHESKEIASYLINRFASDWDLIEKQLKDDTFWYFLQSEMGKYNKGTRIDFLFDLHIGNRNSKKSAFRHYEDIFKNTNFKKEELYKEWEKIVQLFYKLIDWHNDTEAYHYIGFLTVNGIKNIYDIVESSKGKKKDEFIDELKGFIKKEFKKLKKRDSVEMPIYGDDLEHLSYIDFYTETKRVLALYNIMYYVDNKSKNKFPFKLYVAEDWSLEHIVPQNPRNFEKVSDVIKWLEQLKKEDNRAEYLEGLINNLKRVEDKKFSELEENLKEKLKEVEREDVDFKSNLASLDVSEVIKWLEQLIKEESTKDLENLIHDLVKFKDKKFSELDENLKKELKEIEREDVHSISNLVLLDKSSNSSLSNKFFKGKREKILEFDRNKKAFIPMETLNVFNKTFSEEMNYEGWSLRDGEKYKTSIIDRLKEFLPEQKIVNNGNL